MEVNSSSFNDSLVPPHLSSIISLALIEIECFTSRPYIFILTFYSIVNVLLLLPASIFILYHGFQQLHSSSSTTASHSDCFTYHMVMIELVGLLSSFLSLCAVMKENLNIVFMSIFLRAFKWHGQNLLHMLTCVERYLAVVHPITYRSLRNERGVRIRNISIGCVWIFAFVGMILLFKPNVHNIVDLGSMVVILSVVSFCSVSVLHVLIRPGPQEQGRERADKLKQRAFYTIVAILAALVFRFIWGVAWTVLDLSGNLPFCLMLTVECWIQLPSSLVLPVLFLQKEGKLMCRKTNKQVG